MMYYFKTILISAFLFSFSTVFAQYTDVINSNRPGASRSAFSVGTNVLQFELGGFSVTQEHELLNTEVSGFGVDFSARYGFLFEQLEVNIEGIYQNDTFTNNRLITDRDRKRANFTNFTIGAKYLIYDPNKNAGEEKPNLYSYHANRRFKWKSLLPAIAVYVGANFDSKDNELTPLDAEGISPKVMVATQNNFAGGWVLVTNYIYDRIGNDVSELQSIITLTHSFSEKWVAFVEIQNIKSDFYSDDLFRLGGAYLWNKNFQLDANIAFNTKDTPTVFNVGFGASYRFDMHKDKIIKNNNDVEDL